MKKILIFLLGLFFLISLPLQTVFAADTCPDGEFPGDIENVKAEAGNKDVKITWDAATDNKGVVNYKIYYGTESVTLENQTYNKPVITAGNVTEYIASNLENNTTYYFALTGIDAANCESERYSIEVSATPRDGLQAHQASVEEDEEEDTESPKLESVKSNDNTHVEVTFSEDVVLPADSPEKAFTIETTTTGDSLAVTGAELNAADLSKVILVTAKQTKDTSYIVTVGITVEDTAGNKIVSGSNDTAQFTGLGEAVVEDGTEDEEEPAPTEDKTAPTDATSFLASLKGSLVSLTWNPSSSTDLDDQVLYRSDDQGATYSSMKSMDKSAKSFDVSGLQDGKKYYFKLTSKDKAENESKGVITSITFQLAETGPGILGLLAISLGLGRIFTRKK